MTKWKSNLILLTSFSILIAGCTTKYITPDCPYVEPIKLSITTNADGGLDKENTKIALHGLKYFSTETKRLKKLVLTMRSKKE